MERFFQLLFLVIGLDAVTRAFVTYLDNGPIHEEYERAKTKFCHVLGVEDNILFPPDFPWPQFWSHDGPTRSLPKDDNSTPSTDDLLEDYSVSYVNKEIQKSVEVILRNPSEIDCISMTGMSFGYTLADGSISHVADNLNLSFTLGGRYTIMGEGGTGKSTIFKVSTLLHACDQHGVIINKYLNTSRDCRVSSDHLMVTLLFPESLFIPHLIHGESRWELLTRRPY